MYLSYTVVVFGPMDSTNWNQTDSEKNNSSDLLILFYVFIFSQKNIYLFFELYFKQNNVINSCSNNKRYMAQLPRWC